jgi:transcriptional regulator with XRE-family HTH domain/Zn-dependent peptidase ImmA (M78 family)
MATRAKGIGKVIREARKSRGLTQAEIAPTLGVSRSSVAQMESGKRAVRAEDVERLALRYGCSTGELLSSEHHDGIPPEDIVLSELFAALPKLQEDEKHGSFARVLRIARVLTSVESMLGFEAIANALPSYDQSRPETSWHAARQGYRASEDERRRLALGEGPIRFVDELVTSMGVRTARTRLPRGVNSVFVNSPKIGCLVLVDEDASVGRRRLNYAHGLAHALFDRHLPWRVCGTSAEMDFQEVRANAFAGGFLLPEHGVRRYLETLGKETLARSGPAVLSVYFEGESDGNNNLRIDGRAREGRHPITLSDLTLVAHYYGATRSLTAHRLRNLRLMSDEQIERFERMLDSDTGRNARKTLALKDVPHETDSLCSRLAALAAEARNRELIDSDTFNTFADIAGVPPPERSKLLELSKL